MTISEWQNPKADFSLVLSFEDARKVVEHHAAAVAARGTETLDLLILLAGIDLDADACFVFLCAGADCHP